MRGYYCAIGEAGGTCCSNNVLFPFLHNRRQFVFQSSLNPDTQKSDSLVDVIAAGNVGEQFCPGVLFLCVVASKRLNGLPCSDNRT